MEQQTTCKYDPGPQMEVNDVIFIQPQCSQRVVLAGKTINKHKHPCIHFQESEMEKRIFENTFSFSITSFMLEILTITIR